MLIRLALAAMLLAMQPALAAAPGAAHVFRFEWIEGGLAAGRGSEATLDAGALSAGPALLRRQPISWKRRLAVRLDGPGPAVALAVALGSETPGCTVRINGVALSTIPRVIDPAHRVGSPVTHQIEIIVPAGVAPGAFLTDIHWTAQPY